MTSAQGFHPKWASPPGETIQDVLDERSISLSEFADMIDLAPTTVEALLDGSEPISIDAARLLSSAVGATVEFWITRDCQYRDDLERVATDLWVSDLPTQQMEKFGWIEPAGGWASRVSACLQFFGVRNVEEWRDTYSDLTAAEHFRTSESLAASPGAVSAWLRQGELRATDQKVGHWDSRAFQDSLVQVKRLTRVKDPRRFVPRLTEICAAAGVALVVLRAPKGCPVSGVARFLTPEKASIVLSARHLSDDHLWFTFFHEAGHLLLHNPAITYVDELSDGKASSSEEREANSFASQLLLPRDFREQLPKRRLLSRDILALAKSARVAPGVVVGQLQHEGILGYQNLNQLKRRYRWVGTSLEKA